MRVREKACDHDRRNGCNLKVPHRRRCMMNRSHSRVAARVFGYTFSALFAVSGACAPGVPTNPGEPVDTQVGSVAVTPTAPSLQVGGATQLSAVARTVDGAVVTGATAAWSSSNHAVATVSATGLVSALSPGTADISATVSGVVGHA